MKIFKICGQPSKLKIAQNIAEPERSILNQCTGVIDNFLKDKKNIGNISIVDGDLFGNRDYISVIHRKPTLIDRVSLLKNGESPFLRKVYTAIEMLVKDV